MIGYIIEVDNNLNEEKRRKDPLTDFYDHGGDIGSDRDTNGLETGKDRIRLVINAQMNLTISDAYYFSSPT